MSIEAYADIMIRFYVALFLFSVFAGVVAIWNKIRKRTLKYWWIIPCTTIYAIIAAFHVFVPYIAYDDPADPNYRIYEKWELQDFILNDLKLLIIGLFVVALFYLVLRRREHKEVWIFFAVLLAGAVIWILFSVTIKAEGFDITCPAEGVKRTLIYHKRTGGRL